LINKASKITKYTFTEWYSRADISNVINKSYSMPPATRPDCWCVCYLFNDTTATGDVIAVYFLSLVAEHRASFFRGFLVWNCAFRSEWPVHWLHNFYSSWYDCQSHLAV
jgi:hypothetical protein